MFFIIVYFWISWFFHHVHYYNDDDDDIDDYPREHVAIDEGSQNIGTPLSKIAKDFIHSFKNIKL